MRSGGGSESRPVAGPPPVAPLDVFIPLEAPSMNALLQIIWSQKRIETRPEIRLFRSRLKQFLPRWDIATDSVFDIAFHFHEDWFYKGGTLKRKDVPNLIKCCLDAIAEFYHFDDSRVIRCVCQKVQCQEAKGIHLRISQVPMAEALQMSMTGVSS